MRGLILTACLLLLGAASAQEIDFLTPELIDHGRVEEGTELKGHIHFINRGGEVVRIKQVKTGCGCTAANLRKNEIAPGDTADIQYILRTKHYSGLMRKAVMVEFVGRPPNRRYILQADVYTDILLSPKYLHFRGVDVNPDTVVTEILTINNISDRSLVCHAIDTNSDAIRAAPSAATIGPGGHAQIAVSLKPSEAGRWTYYLQIETDHVFKSSMRIPVFAHVR